jgi:transcriptional regulator with XRE-family HTH domain
MLYHYARVQAEAAGDLGGRMDQRVGREVKRLREEHGWSRTKLAAEADMSASGVSMIENGQRNLTTTTLAKLAEALGVEVADLFPKSQTPLFTQPPSKEEAGEREGPIPNSLAEALEWAGAPTRLLSLPREEFEGLYVNLTPEKVLELNRDLVHERELLKPVLHRWRTMPPSRERSRLYALWQESLVRALTGAAAAERAGDTETAEELVNVA